MFELEDQIVFTDERGDIHIMDRETLGKAVYIVITAEEIERAKQEYENIKKNGDV